MLSTLCLNTRYKTTSPFTTRMYFSILFTHDWNFFGSPEDFSIAVCALWVPINTMILLNLSTCALGHVSSMLINAPGTYRICRYCSLWFTLVVDTTAYQSQFLAVRSRSSPCWNSSPSIKSCQCSSSSRLVVDHSQWFCFRIGPRQRLIPSSGSSIVFSCRLLIVHPASRPFVQSQDPSPARAMCCSTARLRLVLARLDFMALLTRRLQQTVHACSPLCQSLSNSKVVQCRMWQPLIGPSPHSVLESSHLHHLSS